MPEPIAKAKTCPICNAPAPLTIAGMLQHWECTNILAERRSKQARDEMASLARSMQEGGVTNGR
jgi:hypothetical protein